VWAWANFPAAGKTLVLDAIVDWSSLVRKTQEENEGKRLREEKETKKEESRSRGEILTGCLLEWSAPAAEGLGFRHAPAAGERRVAKSRVEA